MPKGRASIYALLLLFLALSASALYGQTSAALSHCIFQQAEDHFTGGCGHVFDQTSAMTLKPAAAITTGIWRTDIHPSQIWSGDMTDQDSPNAALELEIYSGGWGVLRTEYGWYPVTHFVASPLTFDLDASNESREIVPRPLDQKIVQEAARLLSTPAVWNRTDDRHCPTAATTWSIYCAMIKASISVTGGSHHRRPAMETVRAIVDERTATRGYHHRLMEYNNDPTTTLRDVQSLFSEAQARMQMPKASS
ncbi:hypothetical protein [Granulicella sp. S156]|uniref:DUF6197 family protein n=1 Tax=Granulicella sp. S156 TaxID=1747224 RepID=UPI00131B0BEC|nr:hypothetical protein [Granulicella sp. S156]